MPSRESPEAALDLILERGYSACEIDFEAGSGWITRSQSGSERSRATPTSRSPSTPPCSDSWATWRPPAGSSPRPWKLDRSAGIAAACGAEVVVFHPGFLLGRSREDAIAAVVDQLGTLRERLEGKDRGVPFGIEVMGRVRDLGSVDDVVEISRRTGWVRTRARLRPYARDERRVVPRGSAVRRGARERRRRRSRAPRRTAQPRATPRRSSRACGRSRARVAPSRCAVRSRRHRRPTRDLGRAP